MKNRMCKTNCYKKCCAFLAALLMLAVLALPGMAAAPLVRDEMGLFDADTYNELEQSAEAASSGHDCDVYFLVVNDIGDANQRDFAKNYYVNNGLGSGEGKSGILFLLAVGSRKYVTITYGGGVTAFTDYRIEQMEDDIVPELSDGDWAGAARTYIEMADYTLDYYAEHGEPIDVDNDLGAEGLLFVIGIPAAIAAGVCLVFYHQMKTAKEKTEADDYMPGLKLRVKRDVYTHTTQTRVYDPPKEEKIFRRRLLHRQRRLRRLVGWFVLRKNEQKNTPCICTEYFFWLVTTSWTKMLSVSGAWGWRTAPAGVHPPGCGHYR